MGLMALEIFLILQCGYPFSRQSSESDVYRSDVYSSQILYAKVDHRTVRVKLHGYKSFLPDLSCGSQ